MCKGPCEIQKWLHSLLNRPLQLLYPLEAIPTVFHSEPRKASDKTEEQQERGVVGKEHAVQERRPKRDAAVRAREQIRTLVEQTND